MVPPFEPVSSKVPPSGTPEPIPIRTTGQNLRAVYDRSNRMRHGGGAMRSVQVLVGALMALVVVATSCSPPPSGKATTAPGNADAPRPAAQKHIVAAVRGDPRTLSDAIN